MKKQLDIQWDQPEDFALVPETTTDGDLLAARQQQSTADKTENDQRQTTLDTLF